MKILIAAGLFYPAKLGGPANTLFWLSKAFVKNGHVVNVVTSSREINKGVVQEDEWNNVEGVNVKYCKERNKLGWAIIRSGRKECEDADVLILSSVCYLPNLWIAQYALKKGIRVIWSPRGELLGEKVHRNTLKKWYFRLINIIGRNRIVFHATSEEEKLSIRRFFGNGCQIHIIPNYLILPSRHQRRDSNPRYFLFVGRIAPIKLIENLIRALAISSFFMSSGYLLKIAGGIEPQFENYGEKLKELTNDLALSNRVVFMGAIDGDHKYQCYADADFLFLVSRSENFGNVVVESLSQGTPVVASKGTPWETLNQVKAGFWVDNPPEELARIIDIVLQMRPDEYDDYRKNAYTLAQEFDVFQNIGKWESILK